MDDGFYVSMANQDIATEKLDASANILQYQRSITKQRTAALSQNCLRNTGQRYLFTLFTTDAVSTELSKIVITLAAAAAEAEKSTEKALIRRGRKKFCCHFLFFTKNAFRRLPSNLSSNHIYLQKQTQRAFSEFRR